VPENRGRDATLARVSGPLVILVAGLEAKPSTENSLIRVLSKNSTEPWTYGLKDESPGDSYIQETPSKSDINQESQIDRPEPEVGPSEVE
jgi:hypothetical protein